VQPVVWAIGLLREPTINLIDIIECREYPCGVKILAATLLRKHPCQNTNNRIHVEPVGNAGNCWCIWVSI